METRSIQTTARHIGHTLLLAGIALISSCDDWGNTHRAAVVLHEVVSLTEPYMPLHLNGLVVNQKPQGYQTPVYKIPIDELVPEGSAVEPGDHLMTLNVGLAKLRLTTYELAIQEQEHELLLEQMQTADQIHELSEEKSNVQQQLEIIDARIAASQEKDHDEIAIAKGELDLAKKMIGDAKRRLVRLENLQLDAAISPREVEKAWQDYEVAQQAARVPAIRLEYLKEITGSTMRQLLEYDRDTLALDLGNNNIGGIFKSITALRKTQQVTEQLSSESLRRLYASRDHDINVVGDNVIRARQAGVLRYQASGINVGDRYRQTSIMFVLQDKDMGFTFDLPVRWRNMVTVASEQAPDAGRVSVNVPQLGIENLEGQVRSISTVPYKIPGGRAYRCSVWLTKPIPGLSEGMQVDCTLHVPVHRGSVAIPSWTVRNPHAPWVVMADGSKRPVTGHLIGHQFVVSEGLATGETILAMAAEIEGKDPVRLSGFVIATNRVDLRVPWRVEIAQMVDNGHYVEKGDVVAKLIRLHNDPSVDLRQEAEQLRQEAAAQLAIAQIEAEAELIEAYIEWRKAVLHLERVQFQRKISRYVIYEEEEVVGDVEQQLSSIEVNAAKKRLADLDDIFMRQTVSEHGRRDTKLASEIARLVHARSEITAVAAARHRNWIEVWDDDAKMFDAEHEASVLRSQYSLAREAYQIELARAANDYRVMMKSARYKIDRLEQETVLAPISGHVYHNSDYRHWNRRKTRPLETGHRIYTTRPFHMPIDNRREVRVEVPARYHGRIKVGDHLPVHLSVLGPKPIDGMIMAVTHHFHRSKLAEEELHARRSVGSQPMVFTATVELMLQGDQMTKATPGVMAWIEVKE